MDYRDEKADIVGIYRDSLVRFLEGKGVQQTDASDIVHQFLDKRLISPEPGESLFDRFQQSQARGANTRAQFASDGDSAQLR